MNPYLDDARDRREQQLRTKAEQAVKELEDFKAQGRDISGYLNPPVAPNMKIARWTNLKLASRRLAPEGFEPVLLLEKWPVLDKALRVKTQINPDSKNQLLKRDPVCCWCGANPSVTVDHVIPLARGGTHRFKNLVGSCRECNEFKADFVPKELGWRLKLSLTCVREAQPLS